jgi:hypothetical protein
MVLELVAVVIAVLVGAVAVFYAATKGFLGQKKTKSSASVSSPEHHPPAAEKPAVVQNVEVPAFFDPAPVPAPAPAIYETVQPAPAPVTYSPPTTTAFGAPSLTKKPTRTYRRRTAPVRSAIGAKAAKAKVKKS